MPKKPNDSDKIYITGSAGNYQVVPPTAYAKSQPPPDSFVFKNLSDGNARILASGVFGGDVDVNIGGEKTLQVLPSLPPGVYDYVVVVGNSSLAQGNSAPRIIIDG